MKKTVIYGLAVFIVYMILTYFLRLVFNKMPENPELFGVYKYSDIWLGLALAVILSYSRYMKRNIGNKK